MSDLFAGVYGARFPEVVMNSGPLPPSGGLPAPLHDTPDSRINYGSTLLGDLQPYAYGEAGYMSSQSQNNQPHRIQKIIPELYLPEPNGKDVFKLSHSVDDSDLAFVMRLNRNSLFCTGSRTSTRRNTKIGTSVDPIINLATLNYLLAGIQISMPLMPDSNSLWWEFLHNLDPNRWPITGGKRNYDYEMDRIILDNEDLKNYARKGGLDVNDELVFNQPRNHPFTLDDIIHVVRHCIKPFGIVRGSEKQGGQHEMSSGPATWTVPSIATLVIDGKEANVLNLWQHKDMHAGDDLILRLKLMPVNTYTLNHYFKGFSRKSFEVPPREKYFVWQLVPDIFELDILDDPEKELSHYESNPICVYDPPEVDYPVEGGDTEKKSMREVRGYLMGLIRNGPYLSGRNDDFGHRKIKDFEGNPTWAHVFQNHFIEDPYYFIPWQELGFWHIGRSQVMRKQVGTKEFYNDDMANNLRTNHVDMTFQPNFQAFPRIYQLSGMLHQNVVRPRFLTQASRGVKGSGPKSSGWAPQLRLERVDSNDEPVSKRAHHGKASHVTWDVSGDFASMKSNSIRRQPAPRVVSKPQLPGFVRIRTTSNETPFAEPVSVSGSPDVPMPSMESAPADETINQLAAEAGTEMAAPALAPGELTELPAEITPVISESSREELMSGMPVPKKTAGKAGAKSRKPPEAASSRGPVEGTLLRPGAAPEACQMELL